MTSSYNPITASRDDASINHPDELVFLPLGGAGEIGMNLNLYGFGGKWLMVDLGISFADDSMPGIDIIMPDPAFIVEHRADLVGIVATHAHEDHIGAIAHLWPRLKCPVYATPFTAAVLRAKLAEAGLLSSVKLIEVPMSGKFSVGPFDLELITLTHSIPEPNALVIRTKAGTVLHTGDWKFDPEPLIGPTADVEALKRLGDEGVDALIGDSTNALRAGEAGSEADVRRSLIELVGLQRKRVVVACFSSNVARLESAAIAGVTHGRTPALVGRSLLRMAQAAKDTGYLTNTPNFIGDEQAAKMPRDKVLLICTGSQGEPRSALVRIANNDHPTIELEKGDAVIFSSRIIPGNEVAIGKLQNLLAKRGIDVLTENDHFVHVSGHPARDELARMYQLVRPKLAVPVHGEARHMKAHAQLAADCQVPQTLVVENGHMIRLVPGPAKLLDHVDSGRLALDGRQLVSISGGAYHSRFHMANNGSAVATLVFDSNSKLLAPPQITLHGILAEEEATPATLITAVDQAIKGLTQALRGDDVSVRDAVRSAIRRSLKNSHSKRPVTDVQVIRV